MFQFNMVLQGPVFRHLFATKPTGGAGVQKPWCVLTAEMVLSVGVGFRAYLASSEFLSEGAGLGCSHFRAADHPPFILQSSHPVNNKEQLILDTKQISLAALARGCSWHFRQPMPFPLNPCRNASLIKWLQAVVMYHLGSSKTLDLEKTGRMYGSHQ